MPSQKLHFQWMKMIAGISFFQIICINFKRFEQVHSQVEELEELLTRLQTHMDDLVSYRRELTTADEQLSKTIFLLASLEENTDLAKMLSRLAETHERLSVVEKHESEQDAQQLVESFQVGKRAFKSKMTAKNKC